jgi:DNA (cytosine-5)-methyltransferase 1
MKILNLYAGLGGNSNLWDDTKHQIVNIELDERIASVLQDRKPNQIVLVRDAHQFLLENHNLFDIIWSSPPCQSHSKMNKFTRHNTVRYVDGKLFEEIIFLKHWFKGSFVVENVTPYYEAQFNPQKIGRHLFWSNVKLTNIEIEQPKNFINLATVESKKIMMDWLGIHYEKNIYYGTNHCPVQILRNCVHPKVGLSILNDILNN